MESICAVINFFEQLPIGSVYTPLKRDDEVDFTMRLPRHLSALARNDGRKGNAE
jgi:hypothetical protein